MQRAEFLIVATRQLEPTCKSAENLVQQSLAGTGPVSVPQPAHRLAASDAGRAEVIAMGGTLPAGTTVLPRVCGGTLS